MVTNTDVDHISSDEYFSSDDAEYYCPTIKKTIRGPGYKGNESFDEICIFGNELELSFKQEGQLCKYVEDLAMPPIKIYVCKMLESQTKYPECKMDFSSDFTHQFLLPLLKQPTSPDPLSCLVVQIAGKTDVKNRYCRMKEENGKAIITAGWAAVVQAFKLKKGDICIFSFHDDSGIPIGDQDPFGVLTRLVLLKLEEDEMQKITIRGPDLEGVESFDKECVFGNKVEMTYFQTKQLKKLVEVTPRPKIKEYVCQITKTNVLPDCTTEFGAEFTCYYLTEILRSPYHNVPHVSVVVTCTESIEKCYCRIKIGQLGKATIIGGWKKVVQIFKMQEGEVCVFSFKDDRNLPRYERNPLAWLRMMVTKLAKER